MSTILKTEKLYKRINNKALVEKFVYHITSNMDIDEIKRYYNEFKYELDFNIYQYGNLDIHDYDLYKTLYFLGLRTKSVMNYHNNLDTMPFPCKYREDIRNTYKRLVRLSVQYLARNNWKVY